MRTVQAGLCTNFTISSSSCRKEWIGVLADRFLAFRPGRDGYLHGRDLEVLVGWTLGSFSGVECLVGQYFGSWKGGLPKVRFLLLGLPG